MDSRDISIKTDRVLSDDEIIASIDAIVSKTTTSLDYSSGYDTTPEYSVRELANILGVSVHTVRFYDNEHLFPFVSRDSSNERSFSRADMAYGKMVLCLRHLGLSIHDCRLFILDTMEGDETASERLKMLIALHNRLESNIRELNDALSELQYKIRFYSHLDEMVQSEKENNSFEDKKRGSMANLHRFVLKQRAIAEPEVL